MSGGSERARAVHAARSALDALKRANDVDDEDNMTVAEVEQLAAAARRAVAVVGRLERHQSSGTSGAASADGGDEDDRPDQIYESLREELRRESMHAMSAAVERQRNQLFSSPEKDPDAQRADSVKASGAKDAEDTAAQVTAGLRRARGVLMAEVERTDAAMGVMNDSISSLGNINDEFGGSMKSGLKDSRKLLGTLERQDAMEKYIMWITFAIFMLVVFYICYKRLPFIQVHRLASLGYQLAGKRVDTSTAADDGAAILEHHVEGASAAEMLVDNVTEGDL